MQKFTLFIIRKNKSLLEKINCISMGNLLIKNSSYFSSSITKFIALVLNLWKVEEYR